MSHALKSPKNTDLACGDLVFSRPLSARVPRSPTFMPVFGIPTRILGGRQLDRTSTRLVGDMLELGGGRPSKLIDVRDPLPRPSHRRRPAGTLASLLDSDASVGDSLSKLAERVLSKLPGSSDLGIVGGFYIGHVGIVDVDDANERWVLESAYREDGVHMIRYEEWLARRADDGCSVWHARIQRFGVDIDAGDAEKMLAVAHLLRMRRTHYELFDHAPGRWLREPGDSTNVYCTELPLICADAIGVDLIPRRGPRTLIPLLGPKRLSESRALRWLNQPAGRPY